MELWVDQEQRVCSVCEQTNGCVELVDDKEQVSLGRVCYLCLAIAIDTILGTKFINQVRVLAFYKSTSDGRQPKGWRQVEFEVRSNPDPRAGRKRRESSPQGTDR